MRCIAPIISAGLALITAVPAVAAHGNYSSALRMMLTQVAAGTCPADIMGDGLLKACNEQMPKMQPELVAAGPIKSIVFVKAEMLKGQRTETYKVTFGQGAPAIWHIGGLKDGKFQSAYSNGG